MLLDADCAATPSWKAPKSKSEEAIISREICTIESLAANNAVSKASARVSEPLVFANGPTVPGDLAAKCVWECSDNRVALRAHARTISRNPG